MNQNRLRKKVYRNRYTEGWGERVYCTILIPRSEVTRERIALFQQVKKRICGKDSWASFTPNGQLAITGKEKLMYYRNFVKYNVRDCITLLEANNIPFKVSGKPFYKKIKQIK